MNTRAIHIVHLEDDRADAEYVRAQFEIEGVACEIRPVTDREGFEAALEDPALDVVISDFSLPGYDGLSALACVQERRPEVPFLFCSGAMGEESAVESLKRGAVDYVLKDRIAKLVPAVRRALAEKEERLRRLEAEGALRESEERYRQLFHEQSDTVMVFEFDPATAQPGRILEVNDAGLRLLGYRREELQRMTPAALEAPGQPPVPPEVSTRLKSGADATLERTLLHRDGHRIAVEVKWRVIHWRGRTAVMTLLRDVTEQRQTEAAMRLLSSELARVTGVRFFRDVVGCAARLLEVEVAYVNRLAPGLPPRHETLALCIDGVLLTAPGRAVAAGLCVGRECHLDRSAADKDDDPLARDEFVREQRIVAMVAVPLTDTAGNVLGQLGVMSRHALPESARILAILRLLAVRTAAELDRQRGEKRFADLFEFAPDALVLIDGEGRIVLANQRSEQLLRWSRAELLGQDIQLLEPAAPAGNAIDIRTLLLPPARAGAATPAEHPQTRVRRRDGSIFIADITTRPLETEGGPVIAAAIRDVTAQREAERQLLRAQRLECLGTLAGGIAHDLNNVLTPILGGAELILLRGASHDRAILENIASSARRGANMVRQLLSFGRGNEGRRGPIEVPALLHELARIIDNSFPKNIRLVVRDTPDLSAIEADSTEIHQVLLNLCVNARDAMPEGGTLTLGACNMIVDDAFAASVADAVPGAYVAISVADTGTGIAPELLERIFEPFFTTKDISQGTGLGLSTVRGIVKGNHGFITIHSEQRRGSTFTVFIPALGTCPQAAPPPAPEEAPLVGHGETVLVSDDEPLVRQTMRTALTRAGFNVVEAADGTGALVHAARAGAKLRAIVTDINMPMMDGVALVRAVRRILPHVFIIAVSGRHEPARTQILRSLGVTEFLDKPYSLQRLMQALRKGLNE